MESDENIYQGGYSSLKPTYGDSFTGYSSPSGEFGLTTDFRSANILQEIRAKLATGVKNIEISPVSPDVFESIPKQHFKEAQRIAKLTGTELTIHGSPQLEASGISNQGFSEANRKGVERQMFDVVEKSHIINPKGSSPVVLHSSAILPGEIKAKGEKGIEETLVINTETGSIGRIPIKQREFPGEEKEVDVNEELRKENEKSWVQQLSHISYYAGMGSEAVEKYGAEKVLAEKRQAEGRAVENYSKIASEFNRGASFLDDSYRGLKELFEIAYKKGTDKEKEEIKKYYEKIKPVVEKINADPKSDVNATFKKEIIEEGSSLLHRISPPQVFRSLNEFAKEKATITFANLAFDAYKKFGESAPIISIENPPAGGAFSTGEELKELIEKSREKFVKRGIESGMSESAAREQAEKLLGVTLDVGHMNMLRKKGYSAKEIVEQAEKVAPLVKHVHLSDNFGFEHTELPMGMGNVPIKEIMEKLGKEGYEGKKIIEAGNWWQHFKTPPLKETFEAFGSPIYSMKMAPYWNQSLGFQQGYSEGYGLMLPSVHYETFGAGFSQLPQELGGQRAGASGSRISGRPME